MIHQFNIKQGKPCGGGDSNTMIRSVNSFPNILQEKLKYGLWNMLQKIIWHQQTRQDKHEIKTQNYNFEYVFVRTDSIHVNLDMSFALDHIKHLYALQKSNVFSHKQVWGDTIPLTSDVTGKTQVLEGDTRISLILAWILRWCPTMC